jgi:hypothetical protein
LKLKYVDKDHSYFLDGRRCKSVTALAKIPDDTYHLDKWTNRKVAVGLSRRKDLLESVASHHTDDRKLDVLCEQAKEAAGAGQAAEWGTAAHRVTERVDMGLELIDTERTVQIKNTWLGALSNAKLTVVPELCERVVLYPERYLAGKFDRILRREDGSHVLADLKTGKDVTKYPHAIAIQLALYANAPLMAEAFDGLDGETDVFEPLPTDLDRDTALIIHMPMPDKATIYTIDIRAGQETVEQIIWPILAWRARTGLVGRLTPVKAAA